MRVYYGYAQHTDLLHKASERRKHRSVIRNKESRPSTFGKLRFNLMMAVNIPVELFISSSPAENCDDINKILPFHKNQKTLIYNILTWKLSDFAIPWYTVIKKIRINEQHKFQLKRKNIQFRSYYLYCYDKLKIYQLRSMPTDSKLNLIEWEGEWTYNEKTAFLKKNLLPLHTISLVLQSKVKFPLGSMVIFSGTRASWQLLPVDRR